MTTSGVLVAFAGLEAALTSIALALALVCRWAGSSATHGVARTAESGDLALSGTAAGTGRP